MVRRRWRLGPRQQQRGLSSSVQFAVAMPVLMMISLGIIQGGVWMHGRNVAAEAANAAADVARRYEADQALARDAALDVAAVGGLQDVQVMVESTPDRVRVTLTADAPMIFDIGLGRITESATAPRERLTPP
jgi:Flp pilus assembly protein TadG